MANTYTLPALTAENINAIVTAGQDGTYNIAYTKLTDKQIDDIGGAFEAAMQKNLDPVALSGDYTQLKNTPDIPTKVSQLSNDRKYLTTETDPIFTASAAYQIKPAHITAWNNKLDQDKILNIFDLRQYSANINNLTTEENTNNNSKLQNIGTNSSYILGLSSFINNQTNQTLVNDITDFITEYFNQKKSSYILSNNKNFLVTNISITNNENTNQPIYYQISLTNSNLLNYSNIREIQSNITAEQANNILSNLYNSANYINSLIIDIENNIIYFDQNNNIIKFTQFFGLSDFANTIQDQTEKTKVLNLGTENTYILNANQIIINNEYSLLDELQFFAQSYFNSRKISCLITNNNNILPIKQVFINNNYTQIDLILNNEVNYNSIKPSTINNNNAQTTLDNLIIKNKESSLILDLNQKVIYCKIKQEE